LSISVGRRRLRAAIGLVSVLGAVLPASAAAAPSAVVNCHGRLTRATATADDANPLNYTFSCDGDITAYTIVANRQINDFSTLDDFSPTVTVLDSSKAISIKQSVACEAALPGNGINCYANGSATPVLVSAQSSIEGSFDTTDPYCGVKAHTVKVKGKKGKVTTKTIAAEPRAVIQLVVSDPTGAEFGPFSLGLKRQCPAISTTTSKKGVKATSTTRRA
jgi:hypothetical protein